MRAPMTALAIMVIASFSAVSAFMGPAPVGLHALGRAGTSAVSLRQGRSTTLSLKMQESRGICPICGTDVFTNQARELDENGMYVHSACVEAKLSAEGQTRISEQELAELKAMAAGLPPPPPKKRAAPKPAGAPFGGLFGGLFGGGGGGASSGPEMPDLPQATSVPSQAPPPPPQGGPPPPPPAYGNQYAAPPPPTGAPPPPPPQAYGAPPPPPQAYGAPPPPPQYAAQYAAPPPPEPKTSPVPAGQRVVPQAGVSFPGYFVEGVDYFFSSKNEFQPGEMCGILRSDGNIKFGVIIGVNPRLDINGNPTGPPTYDVQVEKNGSYYQGKFADSLYKIVPDVMRVGIVLQQQAERGWF